MKRSPGGERQARDDMIATSLEARHVPETGDRNGDELVRLMNAYERPIYNFLLVLLHDADVAQDCAQDTFMRAYENLRKGKPVNAPWLYTVARNRAMDEFRRTRRLEPGDSLDEVPVYQATDRALAVRAILEQLSPQDREVLYLFDVAGFKTDEIGAMLGVRGSAIRQRLSRARERFRVLYGAET